MEKVMTKAELLDGLRTLPFIEIFEETREQVVAYDTRCETDFVVRFSEYYTREDLKALIHISPAIPPCLQLDIDALTDYLWEVMDHNAFLTLNGLWYVYDGEEYEDIARFYEHDEILSLREHDAKGYMWFARQVCVVDIRGIIRFMERKNPNRLKDVGYDRTEYLRRDVIVTSLHELRHIMLETNPTLPLEDYPEELGTEFMVERYAQDHCVDDQILQIFKERNERYECDEESCSLDSLPSGGRLSLGAEAHRAGIADPCR